MTIGAGSFATKVAKTSSGSRERLAKNGIWLAMLSASYLMAVNGAASSAVPDLRVTQDAYIGSRTTNSVYVINTGSQSVVAHIAVGNYPKGVAVAPDGQYAYVTNANDNTVSVIDASTQSVTATIQVGSYPLSVAVTPDSQYAYVTNAHDNTVSVIAASSLAVVDTIAVGLYPLGVCVAPDGERVYVGNTHAQTISVIDTATNAIVDTIDIGYIGPYGVAISPTGQELHPVRSGDMGIRDRQRRRAIQAPTMILSQHVRGYLRLGARFAKFR